MASNPEPAYPAKDSKVLYGDKDLYARLGATAAEEGARVVVEDFEIPIRSGKAWIVPKGKNETSSVFNRYFAFLMPPIVMKYEVIILAKRKPIRDISTLVSLTYYLEFS
jgi:hypothetical protein